MKLTKFGQFIRKYRISNLILLKQMADTLGVSSAFLSSVETGKKALPADLEKKLLGNYNFSPEEKMNLQLAVDETKTQEVIDMPSNSFDRQLIGAFCRNFESLDDAQKEELFHILKGD